MLINKLKRDISTSFFQVFLFEKLLEGAILYISNEIFLLIKYFHELWYSLLNTSGDPESIPRSWWRSEENLLYVEEKKSLRSCSARKVLSDDEDCTCALLGELLPSEEASSFANTSCCAFFFWVLSTLFVSMIINSST